MRVVLMYGERVSDANDKVDEGLWEIECITLYTIASVRSGTPKLRNSPANPLKVGTKIPSL